MNQKSEQVVITGTQDMVDQLFVGLAKAGARPIPFPTIELSTINTLANRVVIAGIELYQWLVFTSRQGVSSFFELAADAGVDRLPDTVSIAVIGQKTAEVVRTFGYEPAFVSNGKDQNDFAQGWIPQLKITDRVLFPASEQANRKLEETLPVSVRIVRIDIYENRIPGSIDQEILEHVRSNSYDWLIATSPSSIQNFKTITGQWPAGEKVISIGPTTNTALKNWGIAPGIEVHQPSAEAIVQTWKRLQLKTD